MSGIDYHVLRTAVSMEQVLRLLRFNPSYCRGEQLRGTCPIHDWSATGDQRCFCVHLDRHVFRCFGCGARGNQLDLWRLVHRLPLYEAAWKLCRDVEIPPPLITPPVKLKAEIRNFRPPSSRPATG